MRVLAWPIYTYAGNPLADSGYICFRNLIRAIPEWTWHVVIPDWANEANGKALKDDLDDLPNVVKIPVPMPTLYRAQEVAADPEVIWRYSPQSGTQPIDAVICGSNQTALQVANAWSIRTRDEDKPLVVAWDLLTRDDRNNSWRSEDVELLAHFAGATVADLNIFGSPMMEWMARDMLRKQFSPSVVRETMNRSRTVFAGVPVARIDEVTAGIRKRDKFTVFYGGRLGAVKRVDDLTEIADIAFSFGRDMGMVVCTGSLSGQRKAKFEADFPMVELHVGTGQEEAWRLMAECHAAIMWSKHEMIGSMFVEEMAHGLPLISARHRWIESLLPDDYPYWADDARQAGALLRVLYDRWKASPETYDRDNDMGPWKAKVRESYDSVAASQAFREMVEGRVASGWDKTMADFERGGNGALIELARDTLEAQEAAGETPVHFHEYVHGIRRRARTGNSFVGQRLVSARSNSVLDAYRAALWLGYEDVGLEEPVFRRKERVETE